MKKDILVQQLVNSFGNWVRTDCENREGGTARMTKALYPYTSLFSPIQINKLTVKNRLVMAPMGNCQMAEETGRPNDKMLQYFFARAEGGVGLLTTGLVPISHHIDSSVTEKGNYSYFPRIDGTRTNFMGWRDLAQGVPARGRRIFIQLTPGLGRVGNPQCLLTKYQLPVSASWNPNFYLPDVPCRPLTDLECDLIIRNAAQASMDAKVMGIDGVYLHGHEGYLLDQLTSPAFNRRKLGKYTDWQRFGVELIKAIRKKVGPDYPIMYRIDLSLALAETYGERMNTVKSLKHFRNGRSIADTLNYMENLVRVGVDIFDVDLGCYDNWWLPHPPAGMPSGCFLDVSKVAKEYFAARGIKSNAGVEVPIVAVGKLGYPDIAEKALRDGKCDMVMLGRPVLADPDWCKKAYAGKVEDIRPCIGCQEACLNEFVEGGHPQCAVNPRTAFEEVYPETPAPAEKPCNIAVIGAGPGGIMTAVTAAKRGHKVTLIEKDSRLGGRLNSASAPGIKFDVANYLEYLKGAVERAQKDYGLEVLLSTEATAESLKGKYDKVVVAAGTTDTVLPLPGLDKANWQQAVAVLENPELAKGAKKVVVIGGGVVGSETAYFLKKELGVEDVTVVEMDKYIMNHTCTANRGYLLKYMYDSGIKLLNCTKSVSFDEKGVVVSRNTSKSVPDPYLSWNPILPENVPNPLAPKLKNEPVEEHLDADLIVMAAGGRPNEALFLELQQKLNTIEVYNLGDSFKGGKVFEATKSGYALALSL